MAYLDLDPIAEQWGDRHLALLLAQLIAAWGPKGTTAAQVLGVARWAEDDDIEPADPENPTTEEYKAMVAAEFGPGGR